MELYESLWKPRAERHYFEKHQQNLKDSQKDPSCPICYSIRNMEPIPKFIEFWQEYLEIVPEAEGYNQNTVQGVCALLLMDEEDILDNENVKSQQNIEKIIGSIRYTQRPKIKVIVLRKRVKAIIAWEVKEREDDVEQKEARIEEWTYGWVIPQEELDSKFNLFWNWYQTITIAIVYDRETKKYFKVLLHLEETIAEASSEIIWRINRVITSITYQQTFSNIDEIIERIIERFIFSQTFTLNIEETEVNKLKILT